MLTSKVPTYSIEVTEDIASKIRILAEYGIFAAKGGSCELHFDAQGNISQVVMHTYHKVRTLSPGQSIGFLDKLKVL